MEFSEKGTKDPMNGHFSPINRLESIKWIQFSLCGISTNLIFAHREMRPYFISEIRLGSWRKSTNSNIQMAFNLRKTLIISAYRRGVCGGGGERVKPNLPTKLG